LVFKSISGFHVVIAITIAIENLIRIDQESIFILKTIRDFSGKIISTLDLTLLGASPPPRGHPPYCDDAILPELSNEKMQSIIPNRNCAPSPNGGLVAQEGGCGFRQLFKN
jgi:hypothetical protein